MKQWGRFTLVAAALTLVIMLPGSAMDTNAGSRPRECQIGNLNPPEEDPVFGFFQGQESYAYHVYPPDQCECPEGGFALESITMVLYFEVGLTPVTFNAAAQVFEAVPPCGRPCYQPGEVLFQSEPTTITIEQSGFYNVTVPATDSPVFFMDYDYFIGIEFLDPFEAGLAIDDEDEECKAYVFRDGEWIDMYGLDDGRIADGKIIIYGDIVCGEDPVAAELETWGSLKSLYR